MDEGASRTALLHGLEDRAEQLNAHQLDLIAQIEAHLRAVHRTMRRISTMRAARFRTGPELSNGERLFALKDLAAQMSEIESQLKIQMETCSEMDRLIRQMREVTADLREMAERLADGLPDATYNSERS